MIRNPLTGTITRYPLTPSHRATCAGGDVNAAKLSWEGLPWHRLQAQPGVIRHRLDSHLTTTYYLLLTTYYLLLTTYYLLLTTDYLLLTTYCLQA